MNNITEFLKASIGFMCGKLPFKDKGCHFIAGALVGVLTLIFPHFEYAPIILAFTIGFIKELVDKYIRKTFFDVWDLIATGIGGVFIWIIF
jgi:hypothetical protein